MANSTPQNEAQSQAATSTETGFTIACGACKAILAVDSLVCPVCRAAHTLQIVIDACLPKPAYQAARFMAEIQIEAVPVSELAKRIAAGTVLTLSCLPAAAFSAVEQLAAMGVSASVSVLVKKHRRPWESKLAFYGVNRNLWKPIALMVAIVIVQQLLFVANTSRPADVEERIALGAERRGDTRESLARVSAERDMAAARMRAKLDAKSVPAPVQTPIQPQAIAADVTAAVTQNSFSAPPVQSAPYDESYSFDPHECRFIARKGPAVTVRVFKYISRQESGPMIWEGTLEGGQKSPVGFSAEENFYYEYASQGRLSMLITANCDTQLLVPVDREWKKPEYIGTQP